MLSVIDKLVIVFIYANIVLPQIEVFSVAVSRIPIAAALLCFGAYVVVNRHRIPPGLLAYVHASLAMLVVLAAISVVVKGNAPQSALHFVAPIVMLFAAPVLLKLFEAYGVDRYLRHVLAAILIVAIYVVGLFVMWHVFDEQELVLMIAELSKTTSVAGWYDINTVKIHVTLGVFFPAGILLAWLFMLERRQLRYAIHLVVFAFAVTVSFTVGQVLAAAAVAVMWAVWSARSRRQGVVLALALLVLVVAAIALMPSDILVTKEESFGQKSRQGQQALALFLENPILGRGLGFLYSDLRVPELSTAEGLFVEVSYAMLLASTGLLGLACYAFIYLFPIARALLTAWSVPVVRVLTLSQLAIIIAAAGNPYVWAGGVGLFFVAFLAAVLEHLEAAEPVRSAPPFSAAPSLDAGVRAR
jgi:O-antigen ligase